MKPTGEVVPRRKVVLACVALAAAVFCLYGRTSSHDFINFDDDSYVSKNLNVRGGLSAGGIRWAFTTTVESNWHPLTWLSLMVDADLAKALGGARSLEEVVHLHNTILHAGNSILLLLALFALTRCFLPSLLVAALFAVHPLHVESVAWAAERKDVLSGFFWIGAMLAWAGYARRPSAARLAGVTLLMAFGLLAKPMLVTLPFALLLLDAWPLGRWATVGARRLLLEKSPLFALAGVASIVTWLVQKRGGAASSLQSIPLLARVVNGLLAYVVYLRKTIWPMDLAVFYPHPALLPDGMGAGRTINALFAAVFLGAATWGCLRLWKTQPWLAVGWLWFLGTLVPVIGLVQVGRQSFADRYTYLPLVGVFMLVAWTAAEWTRLRPAARVPVGVGACSIVILLGAVTWFQAGYWKSGETLYRHALLVTQNNFLVHNNLGVTLVDAGRPAEAATEYEAALAIKPDYAEAHNNLGVVLKRQGKLDEAERHFKETISLRSDFQEAHSNLGNVYQAKGAYSQARAQYEAALRIAPDYTEALVNYGTLLARLGDLGAAETRLRRAIGIDPALVEARKNLGIILVQRRRPEEAAEQYEQALTLRPGQADLLSDLGIIRMRQGRLDDAESRLSEALRVDPGYSPARAAMLELRQRQGRPAISE